MNDSKSAAFTSIELGRQRPLSVRLHREIGADRSVWGLHSGLESYRWQLLNCLSQRLLPSRMYFEQVGVLTGQATSLRDREVVISIQQQVDRRPDRHIRAHRGVDGNKCVLGGLGQSRLLIANATVKNRPAVFAFPDL